MSHKIIVKNAQDDREESIQLLKYPVNKPESFYSMFRHPKYFREDKVITFIPLIFWIVETLQAKSAVQIGIKTGTLYFAICQVLERITGFPRVYGLIENSDNINLKQDIIDYNEQNYSEFSNLIFDKKLEEMVQIIPTKNIELLILNNQSVENINSACNYFSSFGKENIVIILIGHTDEIVKNVPFLKQTKTVTFNLDGNVMIAIPQNFDNEGFRAFVDFYSENDNNFIIQSIFLKLGRALSETYSNREKNSKIIRLEKTISDLEEEKQGLIKRNEELNQYFSNRKAQAIKLESALKKKELEFKENSSFLNEKLKLNNALKDELQKEVDSLHNSLISKEMILSEKTREGENLASRIERLQAESEAKTQSSHKEIEELKLQILQLEQANTEKETILSEKTREGENLASRIERLQAESEAKTQSSHKEIEELKLQILQLEQANTEKETILSEKTREGENLASRIERLQAESEAKTQSSHKEIEELKLQILQLEQANTEKETILSEKTREGENLASRIERLQAESEAKTQSSHKEIEELKLQILQLEQANTEKETILSEKTREGENLASRIERLQAESEAKTQSSHKEIEELKLQILQLEQANTEKETILSEKTREGENLASRIERLQAESEAKTQSSHKEIEELKLQILQLEQANTEKEKSISDLNKEIEHVREEQKQLSLQKNLYVTEIKKKIFDFKNVLASKDNDILILSKDLLNAKNILKKLKSNKHKIHKTLHAILNESADQQYNDNIKLKNHIKLIKRSSIFDTKWYLNEYPDVLNKRINPIEHYLKFGAMEGRNPSKDFDTRWYLEVNPDVEKAGFNPLVHYIKFGQKENRKMARNN